MENENEQLQQETMKMEVTREQLSEFEVIGAVITVGVLGFWFGIGAVLGVKIVNGLEKIMSGK